MKKTLETIANIVVILVAVLAGALLIKNNFFKAPLARQENLAGRTISLNEIDIGATKATVLLALSPKCRFCDESAPFYRRLGSLKTSPGSGFQTVGVFGEPVETGKEYLTKEGLSTDAVVSRPLADLGVQGTPTLLVVNNKGKIVQSWIGLLNETEQKEVLDVLRTLGACDCLTE